MESSVFHMRDKMNACIHGGTSSLRVYGSTSTVCLLEPSEQESARFEGWPMV
jgi:hypothetical protein